MCLSVRVCVCALVCVCITESGAACKCMNKIYPHPGYYIYIAPSDPPNVTQIIETVSAMDKDEMAHRQHFTFTLAPEVAHNHNFSLKDNRGR